MNYFYVKIPTQVDRLILCLSYNPQDGSCVLCVQDVPTENPVAHSYSCTQQCIDFCTGGSICQMVARKRLSAIGPGGSKLYTLQKVITNIVSIKIHYNYNIQCTIVVWLRTLSLGLLVDHACVVYNKVVDIVVITDLMLKHLGLLVTGIMYPFQERSIILRVNTMIISHTLT